MSTHVLFEDNENQTEKGSEMGHGPKLSFSVDIHTNLVRGKIKLKYFRLQTKSTNISKNCNFPSTKPNAEQCSRGIAKQDATTVQSVPLQLIFFKIIQLLPGIVVPPQPL